MRFGIGQIENFVFHLSLRSPFTIFAHDAMRSVARLAIERSLPRSLSLEWGINVRCIINETENRNYTD